MASGNVPLVLKYQSLVRNKNRWVNSPIVLMSRVTPTLLK
jgi:hypothetical protein